MKIPNDGPNVPFSVIGELQSFSLWTSITDITYQSVAGFLTLENKGIILFYVVSIILFITIFNVM